MRVELRQLRYFVAVVEANGLRKAARELYVAPSALSRALQQLEKDLGVELLNRSTAGVFPTAAGRDLLEHARSILARADAAATAMREHTRSPSSAGDLLRVGALGGLLAASELTAPILSGFRAARPAIRMQPRQMWWHDQDRPLVDGYVDVALMRHPITHPSLESIPLAHEPRVLLVGARHDVASHEEIDVEAILSEPTVRLAAPDPWSRYWQLDDIRGTTNPCPDSAPVTTLREMQAAVANGRAVISTSGSVGRLAPDPDTRCIKLQGVEPSTILIARRRGDHRPAVEAFIELAGQIAQEHIRLIPGGAIVPSEVQH